MVIESSDSEEPEDESSDSEETHEDSSESEESDDQSGNRNIVLSCDEELRSMIEDEFDDENVNLVSTIKPVNLVSTIKPGCYVKIVNEPFTGYYATVLKPSYDGEWKIHYFKKQFGKYILGEKDFDSREADDLKEVTGNPDGRGYFTFNE